MVWSGLVKLFGLMEVGRYSIALRGELWGGVVRGSVERIIFGYQFALLVAKAVGLVRGSRRGFVS